MDRVIVYVDDAAYAQQVLAPLFARGAAAGTQWVLVACAPRMTHRISKWVSHSARENWRAKWADKLFAQMLPGLRVPTDRVTTVLAKGPLAELTDQLQAAGTSAAQVVDARRPKMDAAEESTRQDKRWSPPPGTLLGSLLTGFGALWVLALE
ncbi:hypothetical protein ASE52_15935 [Acidovorax sp. Root275]|uniref:hypothetical protein n=1 Tax=Acidovorax sp. Root275 TaxID=1736508 RepID=UPI0007098C35|nr:hypothetical protein [Acidovorax sp. Root275]KRD46179.1 hypothetical protein ASE52_15935 [Acidovorax sp. Root275]